MIDASLLPALHDLAMVARARSVVAASRRLNKTPSAVSQQIRRVERAFGLTVFERQGRGIRLTAAGEAVVARLMRVFDEAEAVYHEMAELSGSAPATIRLAISDYLGKGLLVPVLRALAEERTPLHFEITTAHSAESIHLVDRGEVDLAVVTGGDGRRTLVEQPLFEQPFVWVGPRRTPPRPPRERLATEPVLRLAPGSVGRRLLDEWLAAQGIRPVSTIDVSSVSLLVSYATAGVGFGLAPAMDWPAEEERGLRAEPAGLAPMPVKLLMRAGAAPAAPVASFVERMRREGAGLGRRLSRSSKARRGGGAARRGAPIAGAAARGR